MLNVETDIFKLGPYHHNDVKFTALAKRSCNILSLLVSVRDSPIAFLCYII